MRHRARSDSPLAGLARLACPARRLGTSSPVQGWLGPGGGRKPHELPPERMADRNDGVLTLALSQGVLRCR